MFAILLSTWDDVSDHSIFSSLIVDPRDPFYVLYGWCLHVVVTR
jgi:hypothetical protein